MCTRLVVFPVKGRSWCFGFSTFGQTSGDMSSALPPPVTWSELWKMLDTRRKPLMENTEITMDFIANKMNRAWTALEKAPPGTVKSKIHGLGVKLLSGVKPSEVLLKSVPRDITKLEIIYPSSLNQRLVRRRIRHLALRGTAIHRSFYYGSISLLPFSAAFSILPLPNIPFFWILFRAYSNYRALKGSEKLFLLVSDFQNQCRAVPTEIKLEKSEDAFENLKDINMPWTFQPSDDLERFVVEANTNGLSGDAISKICRLFHLDEKNAVKFRESL